MKLKFSFIALLIGALGAANVAHAQDADLQALREARNRMIIGAQVMNDRDYGYDGVSPFSMAFIARGSYSSMTTPLQGGLRYTFVGVGDDDVTDVDVIVQNSSGDVVAQDVDADDTAIATFTPRYSGKYTLFLKLHSGRTATSACAISIFRSSGGYRVPTSSVRYTTDALFSASSQVHNRYNTKYQDGVGQWAIVGSILKEGTSSTFSGIPIKRGFYGFIAVGDEDMEDLDMRILDVNDRVLKEDVDGDKSAVCAMNFNSRQTCSIQLSNEKSDDFSFVLHAILHD